MISAAARDLTDLDIRLSDVEKLILNAKGLTPLQLAEKEVLSIKTDLARLEGVSNGHLDLCDRFPALVEQADDVKTTLLVRLYFAEKDFFRACNGMCDLEIRERRGDALNDRFGFLADVKGAEQWIKTAKESAQIGKGLSSPKRQSEVQRELQELESKVQEMRIKASPSIVQEISPTEIDSSPSTPRNYSEANFEQSPPPPAPTKTEPPKEKTFLEKIDDFFASVRAFFYRLFEKLFS